MKNYMINLLIRLPTHLQILEHHLLFGVIHMQKPQKLKTFIYLLILSLHHYLQKLQLLIFLTFVSAVCMELQAIGSKILTERELLERILGKFQLLPPWQILCFKAQVNFLSIAEQLVVIIESLELRYLVLIRSRRAYITLTSE
jgi:hypothetical protein